MRNVLIALCWLVSLGVLSLHAESFDSTDKSLAATLAPARDPATSCGRDDVGMAISPTPPQRFVAINFGAPLHLAGQKPATGNGSIMPAGLSGNPQVVAATPVLTQQPLLLNSDLINGPCCYEEGIQVLVAEESDHYAVSFDLASQQLGDSFNQFQLWLNDSTAPLLRFQSDYLVVLDGVGAIASFRDDHLLHVQLLLNVKAGQLQVRINGETLYVGERALEQLHSLQFLMTIEGGASPEQVNPHATIAIDNIVVANATYQYTNLQTTLHRGSTDHQRGQGLMEFVSRLKNVSAHAAEEVVLTHLLPPGTHIMAIDSDQLSCEALPDRVICRSDELAALGQANVTLQLASDDARQPMELTVIATSSTPEIDNYDNQVKGRFGGSSSLLLVAVLLVLWMAREWYEDR